MNMKFFQPQAYRKYNPPDEISRADDDDTYVFHINQVYKPREKSAADSKIIQLPIWKIITGKWTYGVFEFEHNEFIIAFFSLEFTVFNVITFIDILQFTGSSGTIIYILLSIIIPMPLIMYYTFISMYSKANFIKFWESVPIGKGFAYSYIAYKTIQCIMHVPICGIFVWYLITIITNSSKPFDASINYTKQNDVDYIGCPNILDNGTLYGSIVYFRSTFNMENPQGNRNKLFFVRWWCLTFTIWILMYVTILCGFRRIYKTMHKINSCLIILMFIPITLLIIYVNRSYSFNVYCETDLRDPQIWLHLGAFLLESSLPGIYVTYAAVTKPGLIPEVSVLWIYIMKTCAFCVISVVVALISEQLHWIYNGAVKCDWRFSGVEMVIAILPELLIQIPLGGYIALLYFILLIYWSISSILYTLHGLLETVFIEFPRLPRYRLFISTGMVCSAILTTSMIFVYNSYFPIYVAINGNGYLLYTYVMVILMVFSVIIYSKRRYENDYYFHYSKRGYPAVKFGIRLSIIFCIGTIILYMVHGLPCLDFSYLINNVTNLLIFTSITPIFIYLGITQYQNRGLKVQSLLLPTPSWGPANYDRKQSRRRCDPAREFKYRVDLPCTHMCLQDSKWLKSEKNFWKSRLNYFVSPETNVEEYRKEYKAVSFADSIKK